MGAREKKRILVADDTLPLRIMLKDVLTEAGHEIVTASDGAKTWKIIEDEGDSFDLLILDLLMPEVTGFEILERLQKSPKNTKVIVITGIFKSGKEIQRLKDLGACGYITKTALVDEILFRVNQVFYMGQENSRSHPRLFMSIPVLYKIGEEQFSNYTSNFSGGGLSSGPLIRRRSRSVLTSTSRSRAGSWRSRPSAGWCGTTNTIPKAKSRAFPAWG